MNDIERKYEREYWTNRTACSVLSDMKDLLKSINATGANMMPYTSLTLLVMVEELQYAFNRMESAIGDLKQISSIKEERSELKSEVKKLRELKKTLETK